MKKLLLVLLLLPALAFAQSYFEERKAAAESGDTAAQFDLGVMYDNGEGVPENTAEAVRWYRLAAEQGYALAQSNLGLMYSNGDGVPENDAEAVRWYRLAAEQGYPFAQFNLGRMYINGEGVPQNNIHAKVWFSVSTAQGYEMVKTGSDIVVEQLTHAERARAQDLATKCFKSDFKDCPY
jgi:TPR repeat protein